MIRAPQNWQKSWKNPCSANLVHFLGWTWAFIEEKRMGTRFDWLVLHSYLSHLKKRMNEKTWQEHHNVWIFLTKADLTFCDRTTFPSWRASDFFKTFFFLVSKACWRKIFSKGGKVSSGLILALGFGGFLIFRSG